MTNFLLLLCSLAQPPMTDPFLSEMESTAPHSTIRQADPPKPKPANGKGLIDDAIDKVVDFAIKQVLKRYPVARGLYEGLSSTRVGDEPENLPEFRQQQLEMQQKLNVLLDNLHSKIAAEEANLIEERRQITMKYAQLEARELQYQRLADKDYEQLNDEIQAFKNQRARNRASPPPKVLLPASVTAHDRSLLHQAEQRLQWLAFYNRCPNGCTFEECTHSEIKSEWLNDRRNAEREVNVLRAQFGQRQRRRAQMVEEQTRVDTVDAVKSHALSMRMETYKAKIRMMNKELDRDRNEIRESVQRITIREQQLQRLRALVNPTP